MFEDPVDDCPALYPIAMVFEFELEFAPAEVPI
jgi:hypothetical protein